MWTFITRAISAIHRHLSERLLQMLLYMDLFPFSFFFLSIYHTDINIESYTRCIREKENAGRLKRSPTLIAFAINARPFLSRRFFHEISYYRHACQRQAFSFLLTVEKFPSPSFFPWTRKILKRTIFY